MTNVQDGINYTYTASGLVSRISASDGSTDQYLNISYDDRNKRVLKEAAIPAGTTRTFYVRDAGGRPMGIYNTFTASNGSTTNLGTERPIYGLSRLGIDRGGIESFELTDHLGNVRAVVQNSGGSNSSVYDEDFNGGAHNWIATSTNTLNPTVENGALKGVFDSRSLQPTRISSPAFGLAQGTVYTFTFESTAANVPNVGVDVDIVDASGNSISNQLIVSDGTSQQHTISFTANSTGSHYIVLTRSTRYTGFSRSYYNFYLDNVLITGGTGGSSAELIAHKDYYPFGITWHYSSSKN